MRIKLPLAVVTALELYWITHDDSWSGIAEYYQGLGWDLQDSEEFIIGRTNSVGYTPRYQTCYTLPEQQITFFLLTYC